MESVAANQEVATRPTPDMTSKGHVLLTHRTKKFIKKGLKFGQHFCCHPFEWNEEQGCPVTTSSRLQRLGWFFNFVFSTAYLAFLLFQCVRINTSDENASSKIFITFAVILFSVPVFFHATIFMARDDLPIYVKSYIDYCRIFEERYVKVTAVPSIAARISGMVLTSTYYGLAIDGLLFTLIGLTRLNKPEQVASIFAGYPLVQVPLCIIFCAYYYCTYAANACAMIFTAFGALFVFFDIMNELRKDQSEVTSGRFQRPLDRILAYRVIQMQADATDRVYWLITASAQFALMLLAVFCTYGAIRMSGLVGAVLGVLGGTTTIVLMVFLNGWAQFYSGGLVECTCVP